MRLLPALPAVRGMRSFGAAFATAAALGACSSPVLLPPASNPAAGTPTPVGHVDVVLAERFLGEEVTVTLDGAVLRSGRLVQTGTPAWRARQAVSPDSHTVVIEVKGLTGRQFRSVRRVLPSELRCVVGRYDAAAAFPGNLRVETRPTC